uniref:Zinc finger PHD-type domain-containing protein n=1 Tax=Kalanchoe fedtschenkoi TaxID=63787 RepID=A0A7N0U252_KALFE
MPSSDDEDETVPHAVLNYHLVDGNDEPVSFATLPVQWSGDVTLNGEASNIFLHGTSHDGLQKIYKQVTAWKFDLSFANPEISVYSKDRNWIKLVKPRKSFETIIRTILITVQCLHFLKHHPDASKKILWDNLAKVFSLYELRPSENDLVDHVSLITEAFKRDEILSKSEVLDSFLKEKPKKRKDLDEVVPTASMSAFIVDNIDDVVDGAEEDESEEEDYDSVCSFCDNGGELLCCEGSCMRSFHPTVEAGSESLCVSLGLTPEQVEGMPTFYCQNCQDQKHQCFFCGTLGSSNKAAGAEVFRCVKATCGRFYHPKCVSKLLHREDEAAAQQLEGEISNGKSFTCPLHRCLICKMEENKKEKDLQFAVCRRCPKAYHRKCLPRKIGFEDDEDKGIIQRAWEGLMPNRILIYCLRHEINDELGTPERNHIKFSSIEEKRKKRMSELSSSREKLIPSRKISNPATSPREVTDIKARSQAKPLHSSVKVGSVSKKVDNVSSGSNPLKRVKGTGATKKFARGPVRSVTEKVDKTSTAVGNKMSLGDQLFEFYSRSGMHEEVVAEKAVVQKEQTPDYQLDADSEKRVKDLMKASMSAVTMEQILKRHKGPSTHSYFSREAFDKNITQGKVEAAVEAVRSALEKLESGASVREAKDICEPRVLTNVVKWKDKLKVYLAPFLHGMRYTSFGRHFTKVDKLEQIVDRLHWYVRSGDMVVDFCCGSNDFSCILKRKLDETGKKCSFKNFDIIQAKNDFNFEQKDWFEVTAKELAPGSQLIMGLNPPFGVKASLANKFIDKALEFKPKLLILIVPPETQRLDEKKTPYDLVWEDVELLSGKSFYLPGSVDENDKQLDDWNVTAPPLYLWSRPDWTSSTKAIAHKHGHLPRIQNQGQENSVQNPASEAVPMQIEELEEPASRRVTTNPGLKKPSPHNYGGHTDGRKEYRDDSTKVWGRGQSEEGSKDLSSRKDSWDKSRRSSSGKGQYEEWIGDQDRVKAQSEEPRGGATSEQHNNGRSVRSDRQTSNRTPHLDRSSYERHPPREHRSALDGYRPGFEREHSGQAPFGFQPDMPGSGAPYEPPGFGTMDADITHDMARLYSYNDRMFSPGPDGLGYSPYVNEISGRRETEMRSLIQNYGRQEPDPFAIHDNYMPNHEPGYNHFSSLPSAAYNNFSTSAANTSYNRLSTSAMERYAPRLDELNHPRAINGGLNNPHPSLGTRSSSVYDPRRTGPQPQRRPSPGSLGFAYGNPQAFAQSSSSGGWIDD